jgi:hypothetical protein
MPTYPTLQETTNSVEMLTSFGGYDHNESISDNEFYDMENLSSDSYPAASVRRRRLIVKQMDSPNGILEKDALVWIDGRHVYYNGEDITERTLGSQGLELTDSKKALVSMGAYLLIWPDKVYINTADSSDCGLMENETATGTLSAESPVTFTLCKVDGTDYENVTASALAPEDPENGTLWLDTSGTTHGLKQYSTSSDMWVSIATTYVRIAYTGIGKGFGQYDGVNIAGCTVSGTESLNGSHIIYDAKDDYIVIIGILDQVTNQTEGKVTISRSVPDMDYVTEAQNRIWGCKYGLVDGSTVNEIYCCALGDFKNWEKYMGISTDSYRASVGTDGVWTGAITYLGYPMFFKENCFHKVYVSTSGAHQIVDTQCRGVQKGSARSMAIVNEVLYYKGRTGIMGYDGSLPQEVGTQLGSAHYYQAVGGAFGNKYYCNMQDGEGVYHLFVYDTSRGLWYKEDGLEISAFAKCDDTLFALTNDAIVSMNGVSMNGLGTTEETVAWSGELAVIGYDTPDRKYLSRFNLRLKLPAESYMDVYLQYDSNGVWEHNGRITGSGDRTFMLPVRPRRCDHCQIKLTGVGEMTLFSLSKIREDGSDVE